jgi:hypothetical protein
MALSFALRLRFWLIIIRKLLGSGRYLAVAGPNRPDDLPDDLTFL